MAANPSQTRSAYQSRTYRLQHSARKNMSSMIGRGIGLIISGILGGLVVLYVSRSGPLEGLMGILFLVFLAMVVGAFFYGLSMVSRAVFGRRRTVTCPYCVAKRTLFRKVQSYVCDGCGHVLRFRGDGNELVKVTCPHCALEWAASPDSGATRCFCCGARLMLSDSSARFSTTTQPCPACADPNPEGRYFCRHCGTSVSLMEQAAEPVKTGFDNENIKVELTSEGMDSISVRAAPPIGLLYFATSRLNSVASQANELPEGDQLNLSLVRQVQDSLEEIEEALTRGPEYAGPVSAMLTAVTHITARLLKDIKIGPMVNTGTEEYNIAFRDLSTLFNSLTIKVTPGVDSALNENLWPTSLVKVSRGKSVGAAQPQTPQFFTVIDNEAELKDWVKRHLPDSPLAPLSAPPASASGTTSGHTPQTPL